MKLHLLLTLPSALSPGRAMLSSRLVLKANSGVIFLNRSLLSCPVFVKPSKYFNFVHYGYLHCLLTTGLKFIYILLSEKVCFSMRLVPGATRYWMVVLAPSLAQFRKHGTLTAPSVTTQALDKLLLRLGWNGCPSPRQPMCLLFIEDQGYLICL